MNSKKKKKGSGNSSGRCVGEPYIALAHYNIDKDLCELQVGITGDGISDIRGESYEFDHFMDLELWILNENKFLENKINFMTTTEYREEKKRLKTLLQKSKNPTVIQLTLLF